jgi:uncharacterized protein YaiI (UPF0178 family)
MERVSEKMKKLAVFLAALMLLNPRVSFSEEMVQRLDGKIAETNESERTLVVDFEHPATGEQYQKEFVVREGAGFKDFKKLSQLKKGDLVSLDYVESSPVDTAVYVIHIPFEKTYFTHHEIAQALVQLKTNPKR